MYRALITDGRRATRRFLGLSWKGWADIARGAHREAHKWLCSQTSGEAWEDGSLEGSGMTSLVIIGVLRCEPTNE